MGKTIYLDSIICYKQKTLKEWQEENPILEDGEVSLVSDGKDGCWLKIGDGETDWNNLPYKMGPTGPKGESGNYGAWETVADITIPEGFSSYNYTVTEATYPDITRITDFYIEISVPKQSEGVISGALQVQAKANTMTNSYTNIARFETWNHANYIMKGALFSKLFGDKRHNQYYGLAANATQSLANNSLLGGLNVGYFKELNFALSDTTKTLPVGTTIKIVGCKV